MPATPDPKLYQLMAERMQDYAIFLLDTEGRVMSWNAGAAHIKQYSAEEIIGRHFSQFYTVADIARGWPAEELRRAMTEGRVEDEGWRIRKDGSRFWANVVITALRDEEGVLHGYSKITRDLSLRKAEEEKLRLSEERFRLLVDGVQDYAIYLLNPEGIVTSWNMGARRIKGYERGEIIGQHFSRFYSADDIAAGKPWAELAMARQHGRAEDEGWRVRKDGSRFWARVVVTALYDDDGVAQGFAKVTQDLTQRRHSEALEDSAGRITDFIAVLAHELRNPLAPIRNAVHLLKLSPSASPAQENIWRIIDRQSNQLSHIVDDLLDISRVTRGTLSIEKKPMEISSLVQRALEAARPGIDAARHTLAVDVPPQRLVVEGDEVRLTQALTNILNNAVRYTDPGGKIFLQVTQSLTERGARACISVADNGRGIAPEFLGAIFGMFVQGRDPLNRPAAGLGVGLALARSIVELHHGTIEATSSGEGQGAEFVLRLPLKEVIAENDAALPAPPEADQPPPRRVLVVDDNTDAATALAALLQKQGHSVVAVHDGTQAIEAAEGFRPEIVLLDIGMPGMNGLEVARRLRAHEPSPRPLIVAVTGWGQSEDRIRAHQAGFDLHMVKPVEETRLREIFAALDPVAK
ncbi:MAG TPA: PAS domain S-box protein [Burkholderiales bacterium]|jgi:PAS domain S-box-containing protein|nr:PAS domain S-box protein [Burkholderiales bacterium]